MYVDMFVFLTSHAVAGFAALVFFLKVIPVCITATEGEAGALPVHGVIVPAGVTRPTWSGMGGL